MAIYKQDGSDNYWVSIYMGPNVPRFRRSTGTNDLDQARAVEAAFMMAKRGKVSRDNLIAGIDAIMGYDDLQTGIPLSKITAIYKDLPDLRVSTTEIKTRCTHINRMIEWMQVEWPTIKMMHQISRDAAIQYGDHLRSTTPVGKTFNNIRANIVRVFNTLLVRGGCIENVWSFVETANTHNSTSGRAFSESEIKRLLAACDHYGHQWRAITIVALYTGLRYGDVANLKTTDIRDGCIYLRPSKTAKKRIHVIVPLHPRAQEAINHLDKSTGDIFPDHAFDDREHRPLKGAYSDIIKKAEIKPQGAKLSFHCLRHTFRTKLAKADVPQELAMKLGGWKEEGTAELYNHDTSQLRQAIESMT